ncbi:conserved phage C-terminal domain-containing protein [Aerococcaceae bacterium NML160702]|nr:conserved phage C-terminal domain-containing protein [Aerococcaceae bacterium NML160702]
MARTVKEGLPYFPLDTDFYINRKIRRLLHSQGSNALAVWTVVMAKIYGGKGYYLELDEDTCFDIGDAIAVSEGAVQEIIKLAIKVRLFDKDLYEKYGILTSRGIQEQYLDIIKKTNRKNTIEEKFLIKLEEIPQKSNFNGLKLEETPEKSEEMQQSKVKENKVNKNNIYSPACQPDDTPDNPDDAGMTCREIVEYLNQKAGTKFKWSSNKAKRHIDARLNEGYKLDDFKAVVDVKVSQWLGKDMQQYLRPETLFGTKFEGYLNESILNKPKQYAIDTLPDELTDEERENIRRFAEGE